MEKENNLVVYVDNPYEGVWTSKISLLRFGIDSFPTPFTKVGRGGLFYEKDFKKWFISLKNGASPGEIIIVGNLGIEYRVLKDVRFSKRGFKGYAVRRMDGNNITSLDVDNAEEGVNVRIRGRKTEREIFKIIDEL